MRNGSALASGQTVRLMMPYLDAARGIYTIVYVYSNGWLGVLAHSDGQHYDVPAHICRPIAPRRPRQS